LYFENSKSLNKSLMNSCITSYSHSRFITTSNNFENK
jgi:hypothetical protein